MGSHKWTYGVVSSLAVLTGAVLFSQRGYTDSPPLVAAIGLIGPQVTAQVPVVAPAPTFPDIHLRINIPATTLEVYKDGALVTTYPVSVGMPAHKSPTMQNQLTQLIWNPSWIPPPDSAWAIGLKTAPPGPRNPLGPVKMPLEQGIRIHGTTKDSSVGRASSHGCFRMHNKDAAALAWYLQQNLTDKTDDHYRATYAKNRTHTYVVNLITPVQVNIVYEPVEFADNTLIIHPDLYGLGKHSKDKILALAETHGITASDISPNFWHRVKIGARKGTQRIPLEELTATPHEDRHLSKN